MAAAGSAIETDPFKRQQAGPQAGMLPSKPRGPGPISCLLPQHSGHVSTREHEGAQWCLVSTLKVSFCRLLAAGIFT